MALRKDQDRGERQHHAQGVRFPIFLPCLVLQEVCFAVHRPARRVLQRVASFARCALPRLVLEWR